MLVLTVKPNEWVDVWVGQTRVGVTVVGARGDEKGRTPVKLGFDGPIHAEIFRRGAKKEIPQGRRSG